MSGNEPAVVLFGDSLTEWGPWRELLPGVRAFNRGIGGETSADLVRRLDAAVVPGAAAVYLMIGINDLALGVPVGRVAATVSALLNGLERRLAGGDTLVVVQSVLPATHEFRDDVRALNRAYAALAADRPRVEYLDVWPALADDAGDLRRECTVDGLHLTPQGYTAWAAVLRPHVEDLLADRGPVDRSGPPA